MIIMIKITHIILYIYSRYIHEILNVVCFIISYRRMYIFQNSFHTPGRNAGCLTKKDPIRT